MRIIETKVFKIEEHPHREKCFNYIRDNWHDLNEQSVYDIIESIKELSKRIGGSYDYSISQEDWHGDYIKYSDYDEYYLKDLAEKAEEYPLTGVCWDYDVITGLHEGNPGRVLQVLYTDTEYVYSDEGLLELCLSNEFEEDGTLYL